MRPGIIAKLISPDLYTNNGMTIQNNATTLSESKIRIPQRKLGKIGVSVGLISLGGESTIKFGDEDEALEIINTALDNGINYIDTAALYGDGLSEERIGKAGRRKEFYLATKTDKRSYNTAWKSINESIERLQSTPDCIQLHHIDKMIEVEQIFEKDGALKAVLRAKKEGLCKYIGITGHSDPTVLLECLKRHPFDTVLGAVNIADPYCYSFQAELIPYCLEHNIGFIAMKTCSRGKMFMNKDITMKDCLDYVWSIPGVTTAITGITVVEQLRHNIKLSKSFKKLSKDRMIELEQMMEPYMDDVLYFRKHHKWVSPHLPDVVI